MKGKNLIMCGLCACIGFIGGEVRAYHKVLNELRTTERPKVTYMDYYDKRQRRVDQCVFQNRAEAEKVLEEMIKINPPFGSRGSSPFLYRTVDRTALAEEKPTGHSLVHFGPGLALEHPAALERL